MPAFKCAKIWASGICRQNIQRKLNWAKNVLLLKDKSWQSDSGKLCKQVSRSSVESNGFDGRLKTKQTTARGRLKAEAWTIVPPTKQPQFIVWPQNILATPRQIHYKCLKAQNLQKLPWICFFSQAPWRTLPLQTPRPRTPSHELPGLWSKLEDACMKMRQRFLEVVRVYKWGEEAVWGLTWRNGKWVWTPGLLWRAEEFRNKNKRGKWW